MLDIRNFQLYGAIIAYSLRELTNKVYYSGAKADLHVFISIVKKHFEEHKTLGNQQVAAQNFESKCNYFSSPSALEETEECSSRGWTILCTDAAFQMNKTCLAGRVKSHTGNILSWFKKEMAVTPYHAEAKSL